MSITMSELSANASIDVTLASIQGKLGEVYDTQQKHRQSYQEQAQNIASDLRKEYFVRCFNDIMSGGDLDVMANTFLIGNECFYQFPNGFHSKTLSFDDLVEIMYFDMVAQRYIAGGDLEKQARGEAWEEFRRRGIEKFDKKKEPDRWDSLDEKECNNDAQYILNQCL